MGEKGVREIGARGLNDVETILIKLGSPLDPRVFVERCARRLSRGLVLVVGVPEGILKNVSKCTLKTAYYYTVEDILAGSRVKNKELLFLMNLLGKKQVKDVVEEIARVDAVIIIGPGAKKTVKEVEGECGGFQVPTPDCNADHLFLMARERVRRYS